MVKASTESAEKCHDELEDHPRTFNCLTNCTEWYLIVQVDNSQIRIPAKRNSVHFSENKQELPILTKDMDPFMNLVTLEEELSTSNRPITQLNRPVNAAFNPSSSNNTSNSGYRRKDLVVKEQKVYDSKLKLNLVGD